MTARVVGLLESCFNALKLIEQKTGKPRTIALNATALEILQRRLVDHPKDKWLFQSVSPIRVLLRFKELRRKPYWVNHFWTKGYCLDTVGLDMEKIQAYVKYQDKKDQQVEQRQLGL